MLTFVKLVNHKRRQHTDDWRQMLWSEICGFMGMKVQVAVFWIVTPYTDMIVL